MKYHVLPVTNPNTPSSSSSSSSSQPMIKSSVSTPMLIRSLEKSETTATSSSDIRVSMPSQAYEDSEIRPLIIPRAMSYTDNINISSSNGGVQQKRRRRVASDGMLLKLPNLRRGSFRGDVGRAASDTFFVTRMSLKLLKYLGVGYRWITRFLALGCYSILLIPGFIQVGYYYFFSNQIQRGIVYGDQPRNRLDLYLPKNNDGRKPVITFVTGGAWIIGYKAWGSLLGQQLSERDIIVACIDYRNFPQGTISDMIKDASQGISFICNNISEYGGDPNRIYLMGQSAGAHIAACALLDQAIKEANNEKVSWSVSQIKAYFGLSGGYNFLNLIDHFHGRGLYRSIFLSIMEGEESLRKYSPEIMVQDPNNRNAVSLLPPIIQFPQIQVKPLLRLYELWEFKPNQSFTKARLTLICSYRYYYYLPQLAPNIRCKDDPMRGGKDDMFEDLVAMIHAGDSEALARDSSAPPRKRMVPEFMLKLARTVSPF